MDKIIYPYACNRCLPEWQGVVYRECEAPQNVELFKLYYKPHWCPFYEPPSNKPVERIAGSVR